MVHSFIYSGDLVWALNDIKRIWRRRLAFSLEAPQAQVGGFYSSRSGSAPRALAPSETDKGGDGRLSALAADQSFQLVRRLFLSLAPDHHSAG